MQEIINKIQLGELSPKQLIETLTNYNNMQVDEYNSVLDIVDERDNRIEAIEKLILESEYVLKRQNEAIVKQSKSEKNLKESVDNLKKQSITFQLENKTLKHQISVLKKESKAAREQIKRNKAANTAKDAKIKRLEKSKPDTDKTILHELNCVYSKGDDVLLIYPARLHIGIDGVNQDQVVLLYTNRKGCFTTAFLKNDDEIAFSTFINSDADIADRTKTLINKNTMQVSEECAEYAQQWLVRVNRIQNMKINDLDLVCFRD